MKFELIYQASHTANIQKEKQVYSLLKKHYFKQAVKMYSTVYKGFPDFIVAEAVPPLSPGFYEVKFSTKKTPSQNDLISLLSPYQYKAFQFLSQAFSCFLVLALRDNDNEGNTILLQFYQYTK